VPPTHLRTLIDRILQRDSPNFGPRRKGASYKITVLGHSINSNVALVKRGDGLQIRRLEVQSIAATITLDWRGSDIIYYCTNGSEFRGTLTPPSARHRLQRDLRSVGSPVDAAAIVALIDYLPTRKFLDYLVECGLQPNGQLVITSARQRMREVAEILSPLSGDVIIAIHRPGLRRRLARAIPFVFMTCNADLPMPHTDECVWSVYTRTPHNGSGAGGRIPTAREAPSDVSSHRALPHVQQSPHHRSR
jgi:hypothetical protein